MTVSLIRSAESHTGTTGSVSQASFTFAAGIAGDAPKGILVFVFQGVAYADAITSVTYGGVTVPAVTGGRAEDTTTEPGACEAFFLGASVPQGAASGGVVVNRTNNTTTMYAVAYLLGGATDLRVPITPYSQGQNAAMAQQSIVAGADTTQIFAGAYSGGVTVPTCANMTIGTGTYLLYSAYAFFSAYETTPTTGTRTRGLTCATDDLGYVIVTVGEAPTAVSQTLTPTYDVANKVAQTLTPAYDLRQVVAQVLGGGGGVSDNLIPVMTSATTPSGVASASGNLTTSYVEWLAFDHKNADGYCWIAPSGTTGWLQYQFPTAHTVTQYAVTTRNLASPSAPKSWTFEGSNNGTTWDTLDAQTNITDWATSPNARKVFGFTNAVAYAYYRLDITASNDASYVAVGQLEMMETTGAPVAYDILNLAAQTLTPVYDIQQSLAQVSQTLTPVYDMRQLVAQTLTSVYDILSALTAVAQTLTPQYDLRQLAAQSLTPTYNLAQLVAQTLTPVYGVNNLAAQTLAPTYLMRQLAAGTLTPVYDTKQLVAGTLTPVYSTRQVVAGTLTPTYNLAQLIAQTLSPVYDVRVLAAQSLTPTYALRQLAGQTLTPSYDVRQAIAATLTPVYSILALGLTAVAQTLTPVYSLRQLAAQTLTPAYAIRSLAAQSLTPTYQVRQLVAGSLSPAYDLRQLVAATITPGYDVRELVAAVLTPAYDVRQLVGVSLTPVYSILAVLIDGVTTLQDGMLLMMLNVSAAIPPGDAATLHDGMLFVAGDLPEAAIPGDDATTLQRGTLLVKRDLPELGDGDPPAADAATLQNGTLFVGTDLEAIA